jgi:hypothetical protein
MLSAGSADHRASISSIFRAIGERAEIRIRSPGRKIGSSPAADTRPGMNPGALPRSAHQLAPYRAAIVALLLRHPLSISRRVRSGGDRHGGDGFRYAVFAASASIGPKSNCPGVPNGIRTRVTAVKGRCPRPLDDGDLRHGNLSVSRASAGQAITLAGRVCTKKCIAPAVTPTAPDEPLADRIGSAVGCDPGLRPRVPCPYRLVAAGAPRRSRPQARLGLRSCGVESAEKCDA